jgi:hypothetical protein
VIIEKLTKSQSYVALLWLVILLQIFLLLQALLGIGDEPI